MIIVSGHLRVHPHDRDRFLELSRPAVSAARTTAGSHDFAVSADPVDDDRVNIYERWADRDTLEAFRGDGPSDDIAALIANAEIQEFTTVPSDARG
ncbi:quinol monooxygenase YgiN [Prauserella sediminis]|uniref:Quinol monooxygenase YgiN n=1 Tax=Prauserella sediminis TaxID=577680 RepID=A0A839XU16_9PSEU|nr:antibiotic biosynthesis monooxygenase [Prauserella sediminis]MBB3666227.1 quinol monooxygenase YgiN [Prauserella sediminis]